MTATRSNELVGRIGPHWIKAVEFAADPWSQIHVDALPALGIRDVELCERLSRSQRGRAKLNDAIHRRAEFAPMSPMEFENPEARLALLSTDDLASVFHFAAAARSAPAIAKLVSKKDRAALHSEIGANAWAFAVKRAPFLVKGESIGRAENFSDVRTALFEAYFQSASATFKQRLQFKAPPTWSVTFANRRSEADVRSSTSLVLQVCKLQFRDATEPLDVWGVAA